MCAHLAVVAVSLLVLPLHVRRQVAAIPLLVLTMLGQWFLHDGLGVGRLKVLHDVDNDRLVVVRDFDLLTSYLALPPKRSYSMDNTFIALPLRRNGLAGLQAARAAGLPGLPERVYGGIPDQGLLGDEDDREATVIVLGDRLAGGAEEDKGPNLTVTLTPNVPRGTPAQPRLPAQPPSQRLMGTDALFFSLCLKQEETVLDLKRCLRQKNLPVCAGVPSVCCVCVGVSVNGSV
jgi:hypothetical protein